MVTVRVAVAVVGAALGIAAGCVYAVSSGTNASLDSRAVQSARAGDLAPPPDHLLLAVLTRDGRVLAKQHSLAGPWTTEYARVAQLAVAGDSRRGPLLAVLTKGGRVLIPADKIAYVEFGASEGRRIGFA